MRNILEKLNNEIEKPTLDGKQFTLSLQQYFEELYQLDANESNLSELPDSTLNQILKLSFESRLKLTRKLNDLILDEKKEDKELIARVYDMNRALRYLEDYVLEFVMKDKLTSENSYSTLQGEGPYFMIPPDQEFKSHDDLQSGDIILSRGSAFSSAAIARIGANDTQFSHLSFLYRNPKEGGKLYTIEAHIEIGSVVAPFDVHVNQKNSRTVVYRLEDTELAHKAAGYMYDKVKTQSDKGKNIDYDFSMQYNDPSKLFCSEVIYDGFQHASNKTIDVPKFKTRFNSGLIAFLNRMGIPVTIDNVETLDTFSPGDIEYDSRFSLIAEWKDPKQLRDSRLKDAILTKMFEWMNDDQYHIHASIGIGIKSRITWLLRRTPGIKKLLEEKLPLNMNVGQLNVFMTLDKIGAVLSKEVLKAQAKTEEPLSIKEILDLLEAFKEEDRRSDGPLFHRWFHVRGQN